MAPTPYQQRRGSPFEMAVVDAFDDDFDVIDLGSTSGISESSSWVCSHCSYTNVDGRNASCALCGTKDRKKIDRISHKAKSESSLTVKSNNRNLDDFFNKEEKNKDEKSPKDPPTKLKKAIPRREDNDSVDEAPMKPGRRSDSPFSSFMTGFDGSISVTSSVKTERASNTRNRLPPRPSNAKKSKESKAFETDLRRSKSSPSAISSSSSSLQLPTRSVQSSITSDDDKINNLKPQQIFSISEDLEQKSSSPKKSIIYDPNQGMVERMGDIESAMEEGQITEEEMNCQPYVDMPNEDKLALDQQKSQRILWTGLTAVVLVIILLFVAFLMFI